VFVVAIAFVQGALAQPAAAAGAFRLTTIMEITGVGDPTDFKCNDGGVCTFTLDESGTISGGMTGTWTEIVHFRVYPNNSATFSGVHTGLYTLQGRSGTLVTDFVGFSPPDFSFSGTEVVTSATGGLRGLKGEAQFGGDGVSPFATAHWVLIWTPTS
jgi:hypothetical protein